jgi:hypothetical protein
MAKPMVRECVLSAAREPETRGTRLSRPIERRLGNFDLMYTFHRSEVEI